MGKRLFEGVEYDYLFDIDMNGGMLQLPFNRGDDPYMAAQQWIWKNDLDQVPRPPPRATPTAPCHAHHPVPRPPP
eukprot:6891433-Prymnesium_polylepis.1